MRYLPLSLCIAIALTACKDKPTSVAAPLTAPAPVAAGEMPALPLADAAANLGFAKHLPTDIEAYFGLLNVPKHIAAVKASTWGSEVLAFIDDKTPAATAGTADAMEVLSKLWGNDIALAFGKGAAANLKGWQELASITDELRYRTLLEGTLPAAAGKKDAAVSTTLARILSDPDLTKRIQRIAHDLSLPPLTIALRSDDPQAVIAGLVPGSLLKEAKEKAKVTQLTTKGSSFTLVTGTLGLFITPEMAAQWIAALPKEDTTAIATVQGVIDTLRAKPLHIAYGTAFGHVIIALGSEPPKVEFGDDPAKSWLARPEAEFILPYASKNLVAIGFMQADVLAAARKPEPFQPIARGLLAGLKQSPVFGPVAKKLEPKIEKLAVIERDMQSRAPTTGIGVAWWEKGLHTETKGGPSAEGIDAKAPLALAPLLDVAENVFAITYHGDPAMSAKVRALMEGWGEVIKEAAKGLVDSGFGGDEGPKVGAWIENEVLPPIAQLYQHTHQLYGEGTGDDHAWVIDLAGQKPALLAMLSPGGKAMPRIAGVDTITQRDKIEPHWQSIQKAINAGLKAFPQTTAIALPEPTSAPQVAGLTSYTYSVLPGAEDLSPTASISDKLLFIGTSPKQHAELAKLLSRADAPTEPANLRWRLNFPKLRASITDLTPPSTEKTSAADQVSNVTRWLSPFGVAQGKIWVEAGQVRQSMHLEATDVKRFD